LEHPHTVPADGAVGVEVEGHQVFWTGGNKPFILVLTTVPPHTGSAMHRRVIRLSGELLSAPNGKPRARYRNVWQRLGMEGSPARVRKPRFSWTVDKEEKLVELWSGGECLLNVSSPLHHDRVEMEKGPYANAGAQKSYPADSGLHGIPAHALSTVHALLEREEEEEKLFPEDEKLYSICPSARKHTPCHNKNINTNNINTTTNNNNTNNKNINTNNINNTTTTNNNTNNKNINTNNINNTTTTTNNTINIKNTTTTTTTNNNNNNNNNNTTTNNNNKNINTTTNKNINNNTNNNTTNNNKNINNTNNSNISNSRSCSQSTKADIPHITP
ncbi:hypothetical protein NFI96_034377, partial [Prochilodus magdalenae]